MSNRSVSVVTALALAGFSPAAFAYLDPSTGSMILSAIVGLFATAGLALKTYWYKIKSLFRGNDTARADASAMGDAGKGSETDESVR